jgi:hypothetical protein
MTVATAVDWRAHFEERAGIAEFDGGLPRAKAETVAYAWTAHEWLAHHFAESPAGCCAHCGGPDRPHDALLPCGTGAIAWVHSGCWHAWRAGRQAEAEAALRPLGIAPPLESAENFGKSGT